MKGEISSKKYIENFEASYMYTFHKTGVNFIETLAVITFRIQLLFGYAFPL